MFPTVTLNFAIKTQIYVFSIMKFTTMPQHTNSTPAAHKQHTSSSQAAHQQQTNSTPAAHKQHTSSTKAAHQQHTNSTPTAHQQQQSNKRKFYAAPRVRVKTSEGFVQKREHADDIRLSNGIIAI